MSPLKTVRIASFANKDLEKVFPQLIFQTSSIPKYSSPSSSLFSSSFSTSSSSFAFSSSSSASSFSSSSSSSPSSSAIRLLRPRWIENVNSRNSREISNSFLHRQKMNSNSLQTSSLVGENSLHSDGKDDDDDERSKTNPLQVSSGVEMTSNVDRMPFSSTDIKDTASFNSRDSNVTTSDENFVDRTSNTNHDSDRTVEPSNARADATTDTIRRSERTDDGNHENDGINDLFRSEVKTADKNDHVDSNFVDVPTIDHRWIDINDLELEVKDKGIVMPHDRQHFNWDCGIACARMILKYFDKNPSGVEWASYFASANLKTSIWTIDLAYLFTHFQVGNRMSTLTLGVDANYQGIDFYSSHLQEDDRRVDALFREAHLNNVTVSKEDVDLERIVDHLETRQPIVILVDWNQMTCLHCGGGRGRGGGGGRSGGPLSWWKEKNSEKADQEKKREGKENVSANTKSNVGYQGHFIVLTGVDRDCNLVYFSNPSAHHSVCISPLPFLEDARKSYGTDEDIIFIYDKKT